MNLCTPLFLFNDEESTLDGEYAQSITCVMSMWSDMQPGSEEDVEYGSIATDTEYNLQNQALSAFRLLFGKLLKDPQDVNEVGPETWLRYNSDIIEGADVMKHLPPESLQALRLVARLQPSSPFGDEQSLSFGFVESPGSRSRVLVSPGRNTKMRYRGLALAGVMGALFFGHQEAIRIDKDFASLLRRCPMLNIRWDWVKRLLSGLDVWPRACLSKLD